MFDLNWRAVVVAGSRAAYTVLDRLSLIAMELLHKMLAPVAPTNAFKAAPDEAGAVGALEKRLVSHAQAVGCVPVTDSW